MLLDRLERRLDVNLEAAARELAGRVLAEPGRNLGENLGRRVDEHPALRGSFQLGVVAERVANQVGELSERLDARVARADEDEAELAATVLLVVCRRGCLQPPEDVVSEVDRVGEGLEPEAVLGETWDRQRARDRAERQHDVSVMDVDALLARVHVDGLAVGVETRRLSEQEFGVRAHEPQRDDDVPRLERSRRGLGEQRCEEHEVLGADDRRAALAEQTRNVGAGEASAHDQRPASCLPCRHGSTIARWRRFRSR